MLNIVFTQSCLDKYGNHNIWRKPWMIENIYYMMTWKQWLEVQNPEVV